MKKKKRITPTGYKRLEVLVSLSQYDLVEKRAKEDYGGNKSTIIRNLIASHLH